ncbi:MAG: transposase [Acidobacteriota bacterium]
MDRLWSNAYGAPKIEPDPEKAFRNSRLMKGEPFLLNVRARKVVEDAVRSVCVHRNYALFAINVRTNHTHVAVSNSGSPERMMDSFKAYSTRALRNEGLLDETAKVWSRHGSTRYLWTEDHVSIAVDYVLNGQGGELPSFD